MPDRRGIIAIIDQASLLYEQGKSAEAADLVRPYLESFPPSSIHYARCHCLVGLSEVIKGNHQAAITHLIPNLEAMEASSYTKEAIVACSLSAYALGVMGDPEAGLVWAARAGELTTKIPLCNATTSAIANLGSLYTIQHDYERGLESYLHALRLTEELHATSRSIVNLLNIAYNLIDEARHAEPPLSPEERVNNGAEALTYALRALPMALEQEGRPQVPLAYCTIADATLLTGDLEAAERWIGVGEQEEKATGNYLPELNLLRARLLTARGRHTDAEQQFLHCIELAGEQQYEIVVEAMRGLEASFEARGDVTGAIDWARRRERRLEEHYRKRLKSVANVAELVAQAQKAKQRAEILESANETLEILGAFGRELTAARTLHDIVHALRRQADDLIRPTAFAALRLEGASLKPILVIEEGQELSAPAVPLDDPRSMLARAAREKRGVVAGEGFEKATCEALEGSMCMNSVMVEPLVSGTRVLAVVTAQSPDPTAFGDRERSVFASLCAYATIAFDNALAYEEIELAHAKIRDSVQQLVSSEKMATLGRLTASIAHEMNTPMATTLASLASIRRLAEEYSESIGDENVTPEDHREIAGELLAACALAERSHKRAQAFVRTIKEQTREQKPEDAVVFDPEPVVADTLHFLQYRIRQKEAAVELVGTGSGLRLWGYPARLSQVITNLVANALDAVAPSGGKVIITYSREEGAPVIEVADNGCGMDAAILSRVFEPLFTTKPFGEGTGLGLPIARDIITGEFGGSMEVSSTPGAGTAFRMRFPEPANAG